jgi:dipeptidyl aminopeptidase/acylaminoacyl peptidase
MWKFGSVCAIALVLAAGASAANAATHATIRDLLRTTRLADPQISPDGKTVAIVETRPDLESDEFRSEIFLVDIASKQLRPLTRERHHAQTPRWSPDGAAIGFLAPDANKTPQLFVAPMAGGDAMQLTHVKDGVEQFAWSPDSRQIAFVAGDPAPDLKGEDKFRTMFQVRNDDFTLTEKPRPSHLWLIPAGGGEAKRLTSGDWSLPSSLPPGPPSSPVQWSPDGRSIFIVRQETPSTGDQFKTRIEVLDVASSKLAPLTGDTMFEGYPKVSPDGSMLAYWRVRDAKPWNFQEVWTAPAAGGGGHDISRALDKNVFGTWWMPDGKTLLVGGNDATTVGLWTLPPSGPAQRLDLGALVPTNGYWMDVDLGRQGQIAMVAQSATDPFELFLIPAAGQAPVQLTHENAALGDLELGRSETIVWSGPGGRKLDGVVTYPPGYAAGTRYPLVLYIHGGPNSSSRQRFSLMPQALAAKGWIVFEPNYRGSDNMGNDFYAAIYQDAGKGPGEDVMSGVEFLKAKGLVDPARMAVSGWSYGGYMTTWMLGHYPVWKAAVAGAAVTDWVEMYDLSDANVTTAAQVGGSPYVGDGMASYRRQSPDSAVGRIRAPTLIMTDTGDFRVPPAQSFGLYRALKDNNVKTELYAIPTGGHFPGDPVRQMDVYQHWIDWLAPYLK